MKKELNTIAEYDAHIKDMFQRMRDLAQVEEVEVVFSPEVQAEVNRRELEAREKDRRMAVERLRMNWGAPSRHVECVTSFSKGWSEKHRFLLSRLNTGMLVGLVGGRGTGKTQLAVELMREKTDKLKSALFCSAMQFFIEIKSTYRDDSKTDEAAILNRYQSCGLLVIDEVGKRGGSEWENNLLFELINRRYNDRKDTVLIDNRTKAEFIETIGPSLASRMNECGGIVECNWESFRV